MGSSEESVRFECPTILDSITDGVFTVDLNARIMTFNRAAERITGIARKEAIGRFCYEVFRANICETDCFLRETLSTQQPVLNQPIFIVRADKKQIPITVTTSLLRDTAGHVVGGVETFRDLSAEKELRQELRRQHSFDDIVSKNSRMLNLFSILPQIAESRSTVLIEGASGTGKELVARAIHNHGLRPEGPFVALNCGALPDTLIESELFGYKAGAFTDAKKDKPGRFAMAGDGTIFLDEIGDISPALQVRLLRVLETRCYEPLGANETVRTNARLIAASNRDIEALVRAQRFREDLYFRINVIRLKLPPLAERKEDIPLLVDHFIERFRNLTGRPISGISREALAVLLLYDWPGNIRELENAIEHAFVLCQEKLIQTHHLPERLIPTANAKTIPEGLTLRELEKRAIEEALARNRWKKLATARELGIDKNTLRRKILHFGIQLPPARLPSDSRSASAGF